jgi:hypothetical protein
MHILYKKYCKELGKYAEAVFFLPSIKAKLSYSSDLVFPRMMRDRYSYNFGL